MIGKNILLIDDDDVANFINRKTLERTGLTSLVTAVSSGQAALDLFVNYYPSLRPFPDVIFLDLNMPAMDGFQFLEAFKKLNLPYGADVKIVIVSSSQNKVDIDKAARLGAIRYLYKPLSEVDIIPLLSLAY